MSLESLHLHGCSTVPRSVVVRTLQRPPLLLPTTLTERMIRRRLMRWRPLAPSSRDEWTCHRGSSRSERGLGDCGFLLLFTVEEFKGSKVQLRDFSRAFRVFEEFTENMYLLVMLFRPFSNVVPLRIPHAPDTLAPLNPLLCYRERQVSTQYPLNRFFDTTAEAYPLKQPQNALLRPGSEDVPLISPWPSAP